MTQTTNFSDDRTQRVRSIMTRINALDAAGLAHVEAQLGMLERVEETTPAATRAGRIVHGAVVTDRPDLIAAAGGTLVNGGPVTMQAPEPEHPAELAKVGGERR